MRESVLWLGGQGPAIETVVLLQACILGLQSTSFHWLSGAQWLKGGFPQDLFWTRENYLGL